jgi:uncharacterized protein YdhG (YjbR/CyaY superfamily)
MAASTIDEYIAGYDGEVRDRLERVRAAVHRVLPDAAEKIAYGMPTIVLGPRRNVYFAAWTKHIGFYPVYRSDDPIEAELEPYREAKDTLRFPHDRPLPDALIERIVRHLLHPR